MAAVEGGVDPETLRKMNCFYPSYIDATITRPKGRRIPTACAVEHPHIMECVEVFKLLKLPYVLEHKFYSRDILRLGRIKYFMTPQGSDAPIAPSKPEFLKMIAAEIQKLKSRTNKPEPAQQSGGKKKK